MLRTGAGLVSPRSSWLSVFLVSLYLAGTTQGSGFLEIIRASRSEPPLAKSQNPTCKKAQLLHSDIVHNAGLEGQLQAGNFTFLGNVKDMDECMSFCCASKKCQLAYLDKLKCYGVKCYSEQLCKITKGIASNDVKISLMVRNDINRKAYVTAYIVVVLVAFGAAIAGTVWAVFIFVRRFPEKFTDWNHSLGKSMIYYTLSRGNVVRESHP